MPISPDSILLKGSSLSETEWVYGIAVFTGHETKIMMNSTGARAKKSDVERKTDKYIVLMVLI
jgi:magnesium-transporting ATPase (P-type)